MKKILAMLLAVVMVLSLAACGGGNDDTQPSTTQGTEPISTEPVEEVVTLVGKEFGVDYISLYDQFGATVTIDMVTEDSSTGLAYVTVDGVDYELGLDFLSMAMVYNTSVPEGGMWETESDVYATWWKLYIQRWNYMLPEIPLYSNEYYNLYNAQIKGVVEYPTNPYWGPGSALIDWSSEKADNSIILGNSTELSGKFRFSNFGANNPGASDQDIQYLIVGLETVTTITKDGEYVWNETVVAEHSEVANEDGTGTYTIKIQDDLVFSDGSPITAKNYLTSIMVFSNPVGAAAAGKDHMSGLQMVGYDEFATYDGTEGSGSNVFTGVRLIDDYTFSVTVKDDYFPYFYGMGYASFTPQPLDCYLPGCDLADDGNGVYIVGDFYAKDGDNYALKDHIYEAAWDTYGKYPVSGPYMVSEWDESDKSVVLVRNPYFKGNYEGTKPQIEKVIYKKTVDETQMTDFTSGGLDVLAELTGGDATNEAITTADNSDGKYVYTHYSRAGYGKLGMRCDFGPVQFVEVRQAIAYCMDRATFAKEFTGGFGGVVDGPYYSGSWMYKAATEQGMTLDAYATSVDSAIAVLEEGGWVYNAEGGAYTDGVRYKRIPAAAMQDAGINVKSKDGAYKTTKVGDYYYMPLVLNWYGTTDNEFSDLLMTGFMENENIKAAGFMVYNTLGQFNPMQDEMYQASVYGYYGGIPMYTCFNFATGFNSAAYDYSFNMTIDPTMYDNYSYYYIKDMADVYWLQ